MSEAFAMRCIVPTATIGWAMTVSPASRPLPRTPSMREIVELVAERHRTSVKHLRGESRQRIYVEPRQEAMYLIRQVRREDGLHRYSLPQIGAFFGRDHTTVLHGVRRHAERMAKARAA